MFNYIKVVLVTGISFFAVLIAITYFISKDELTMEFVKSSGFKSLAFALLFGSFRYFRKKNQDSMNQPKK